MKPAPPVIENAHDARRRLSQLRRPRPRYPAQALDAPGSPRPGARARSSQRRTGTRVAKRSLLVDPELAEEADEERLANREAVDRERHEHDQEEQRAHHVVGPRRRGRRRRRGRPSRSRARAPPARASVSSEDPGHQADVPAEDVYAFVERRATAARPRRRSSGTKRRSGPRARREKNMQRRGRSCRARTRPRSRGRRRRRSGRSRARSRSPRA